MCNNDDSLLLTLMHSLLGIFSTVFFQLFDVTVAVVKQSVNQLNWLYLYSFIPGGV